MREYIFGDSGEKLKEFDDNSIDCLATDPPYGYSFMGSNWDKALPPVSIFKECFRVMKPGAFGFVMSAPRQDVLCRMIFLLDEAGFDIDFTSIYWTYAQGFPKAADMGKLIDKRLGKERTVLGQKKLNQKDKKVYTPNSYDGKLGTTTFETNPNMNMITEPSSDKAKEMDGAYAGYQPKPAVEVIIVVMKPLSEKSFIDQAMRNNKGITWLNNCRVPYTNENDIIPQLRDDKRDVNSRGMYGGNSYTESKTKAIIGGNKAGRFPANLIVSDDVLNDGKNYSHGNSKKPYDYSGKEYNNIEGFIHDIRPASPSNYGDSGSYSRYFDVDKWFEDYLKKLPEEVQLTYPFLIVPKATKKEKDEGLDEFAEQTKIFNGQSKQSSTDIKDVEKRFTTRMKNIHPTVKPIKLFCYLIALGSKENDIILDPFAGTNTTGISAMMTNRKFISMEYTKEYYDLGKARTEYYIKKIKNQINALEKFM